MMKAVLVFCEGRHDIVFAERSLGALGGCKWVGRPIGELPSPFGPSSAARKGLVARRLERHDIGDMQLRPAAHPQVPAFESMIEDAERSVLFVMLRVGSKYNKAVMELLAEIDSVLAEEVGTWDVSRYAAAFLFDANGDGVEATLDGFRKSYGPHFGDLSGAGHGSWTNTDTVPVGGFVFHRSEDDQTGTLEDHLAPMAKAAWPVRYASATEFVDENRRPGHAVSGSRAERLKAIITAAGQLDHPGDPLSQVIGRKGLPQAQYENSRTSRSLVDFLMGVPWTAEGEPVAENPV